MSDDDAFNALLAATELDSIHPVDLRITEASHLENRLTDPPEGDDEAEVLFELKTEIGDEVFLLTLSALVVTNSVDIVARVQGAYRHNLPNKPEESEVLKFANFVGVPNIFPYVRQAVSGLSTQAQSSAVTLPFVRAGELAFSPHEQPPKEEYEE